MSVLWRWRACDGRDRGALVRWSASAAASSLAAEGPVNSCRGCREGARCTLNAGNFAPARSTGLAFLSSGRNSVQMLRDP